MNFEYAIFDMDGTLIDSMTIWRHKQVDSIEKIYGVEFTDSEREMLVNMEYIELIKAAGKLKGIDVVLRDVSVRTNEAIKKLYISGAFELKPYVKEYLEFLQNNGVKIAVATATLRNIAIPYFEIKEIYKYFDGIYTTADDAKVGKAQSPKVYDIALESIGGNKENTVVFEDVLQCIKTCKNAGYRVIAVSDNLQMKNHDEICSLAEQYINTYKEMME